jgi:hypothetical protein
MRWEAYVADIFGEVSLPNSSARSWFGSSSLEYLHLRRKEMGFEALYNVSIIICVHAGQVLWTRRGVK